MNNLKVICLVNLLFFNSVLAQNIPPNENIVLPAITIDKDTIAKEYVLEPVNIYARPKSAINLSTRDQGYLKKVYPYALRVARIVTIIDQHTEELKKNKQKKNYLKDMENMLKDEFTDDLKNLTRIQGQMLTKLIYRETHKTVFDIVKTYKGGFSAGWWNLMGKFYNQDLKMEYDPFDRDKDIEVYIQYLDDLYLRNGLKEAINHEQYNISIQSKKRKGKGNKL
jgi:hypothetical protein